MNIRGKLVFAVTALSIVVGAHGAVVDSADVAGFTTFQDTVSGRVWLDMDNFFFLGANPEPLGPDLVDRSLYTGFEMIDAAQNAGFTFATRDDVSALLSTLPLTAGEWNAYAPIMGSGHARDLIWGMYDDENDNPYGIAFAFSTDSQWNFVESSVDATLIAGGNELDQDMGLWAYTTGATSVPEPATLVLLGVGLAGLGFSQRKRAQLTPV